MSEHQTIQVNFGRPLPLFPLASVTLMPHAVLPVHIFEDRYRRMVSDALDTHGQIAMAVFDGPASQWQADYAGRPPVRPAVCVGQIVQHHKLEDGRYNIALQGVCRARVVQELGEELTERPYRLAMLEPVGIDRDDDEQTLQERRVLGGLLAGTRLVECKDTATILKHLADDGVPTTAILELVTYSLLPDPELRYRLLAEGDVLQRAGIIRDQLTRLRRLLDQAAQLREADTKKAPKGASWN
jgi:Lon protease-like protein